MNKILMIILSAVCYRSQAQVILIKPDLANCVKCTLKLNADFNIKRTGIPTYIVFGASAISDSSEIENSLRYKENGINLVFSDRILRYFKDDNDLIYINVAGDIVYKKKLFQVADGDISLLKDDYSNNYKFICNPSKLYKLDGENLLAVDNQINSATLFSGKDTFTYKMTEELHQKIRSRINVRPLQRRSRL